MSERETAMNTAKEHHTTQSDDPMKSQAALRYILLAAQQPTQQSVFTANPSVWPNSAKNTH